MRFLFFIIIFFFYIPATKWFLLVSIIFGIFMKICQRCRRRYEFSYLRSEGRRRRGEEGRRGGGSPRFSSNCFVFLAFYIKSNFCTALFIYLWVGFIQTWFIIMNFLQVFLLISHPEKLTRSWWKTLKLANSEIHHLKHFSVQSNFNVTLLQFTEMIARGLEYYWDFFFEGSFSSRSFQKTTKKKDDEKLWQK